MRDRRLWNVLWLAIGLAVFSGGCIDAVREGAVAGVESATENFVGMILESVSDAVTPGNPDGE